MTITSEGVWVVPMNSERIVHGQTVASTAINSRGSDPRPSLYRASVTVDHAGIDRSAWFEHDGDGLNRDRNGTRQRFGVEPAQRGAHPCRTSEWGLVDVTVR